jgi:preprotein translocase SecE subunit
VAVTAKRAEQPAAGFTPGRFLREVYDELRKVVWPTPGELYRYTLIVIFTVIVLGLFIGGADYLLGQATKSALYNGVSR